MLLQSYRLEIFNNECMPGAMSVQCFAHLDQDVSAGLPYLNAELGSFEYIKEPPSVTFKLHGKVLTVYGRKIAVNAVSPLAWSLPPVWRGGAKGSEDCPPLTVEAQRNLNAYMAGFSVGSDGIPW